VLVAQATVALGYALVDLAALSFIGLGIQPPNADWGQMVGDTTGIVQGHYATPLAAGACIVLVVSAFEILGNRISDPARED
jgi:peptide/nickel transport system permease protein